MHDAAFLADGRVKADDLDAAFHGLLADRHEGVRIVGRNDDAIDLLGDQRVDDGNLLFSGCLGGRRIDDLEAASFRGGFHGAFGAGVEIAVAKVLHHHGNALAFSARRRGKQARCRRREMRPP